MPFIVSWPEKIEAGSRSEEVVSQVDLVATFAEISGYALSNDEAIDSYNLLPVWTGKDYESPLRAATVQNTKAKQYALRQGDWLFINHHSGAGQSEPQSFLDHFGLKTFPKSAKGLLFNLKEDRRQSKNLYPDNPEKVAEMSALLERYLGGERCAPERK